MGVSDHLQLVTNFPLYAQLRMLCVEQDPVQVHVRLERQTRVSICAMVLTRCHTLESSETLVRFKLLGLALL